jgi:ATP-binding cassette, subfamily C (CFTR/MRP), member 1
VAAQWLPYADQIIVLSEEGTISEIGTYQDLASKTGYISKLMQHGALAGEPSGTSTSNISSSASPKQAQRPTNTSRPGSNGTSPTAKKSSRPKAEAPSRGAFRHYLGSLGKTSFPTFLLLVILQAGCRTMQRLWLKFWVSANERGPDADTPFWVGMYILWGVLTALSLLVEAWFLLVVVIPRSASALHLSVLQTALAAPLSFFVATDLGDIVNRFSQDMRLIDLPLPISFMLFFDNGALSLAELCLTCLASGYLALAIPPLFGALYAVQQRYLAASRQVRILETEAKAPLFGHFISTAAGLVTVRALGLQGRVHARNLALVDMAQRPSYMLACMQHWLAVVISGVLAAVAVLLVGLAVRLRERTDPGLLGVALVSVGSFGQVVGWWLKHWANLEESLGAVERVRRFVGNTPREKGGGVEPGNGWPTQGAISVRGVHASYGGREVLSDINLEVSPGEKVAVCGRTGSGKSTLVGLLLRLQEPSRGAIRVDGIDICGVKLDSLRTSVAALPQDPLFLPGTVRDNIDPFGRASEGEIRLALDRTKLIELVEEKGGLDAELNTDWLNAGQKQLFCMARAMLRQGRVLLLDEATSR